MRFALPLLLLLTAFAAFGCGPKGDDYNPNDIAVKQQGDGPPPMPRPGAPEAGR